MPNFSSLSISVRLSYLFSSTIIGFARVVIDKTILLREIPIFRSEGSYLVILPSAPVAMCPLDMDMDSLNKVIFSCRGMIQEAILKELKNSDSTDSKGE